MNIISAAFAVFLSASAPQKQNVVTAQEPTPNSAGAMFARISQLEEENRKLKGNLEEMSYKVDQLETENKKLGAENSKLKTDLKKAQDESITIKSSAPKPKVVIEQAVDEAPKIAPKPTITDATPNDDFEQSFAYMTDGNIEEAKKGFISIVKKYPGSSLSGEAYYWLGEIAYDAQDYNNAAINYLKGYREYPKGTKAPENILKLALTLKELGKNDEACQNLSRFNTEFKNAHANLLAKAKAHRAELKCQ